MFSIRALARAVPKSAFRTVTSRYISTVPRASALRPTWTAVSRPAYRSFTSSPYRWEPAGQVDTELSAKIQSELSLEKESKDPEEIPEGLTSYLEESGFQIQDTAGKEEVILTRQFGDEQIKVTFSIADLAFDQEADEDFEDSALGDEEALQDDSYMQQSAGPRSKGTINSGRTPDGNLNVAPEDRVAPADRPELADNEAADHEDYEDEAMSPGFPVRVNVVVTKPSGGALQFETLAENGAFRIENVYHFPSADLADAATAEKDFQRNDVYAGPPFENLDEELQTLFERFLEERGVNFALAQFAPDYIDFKEQREYVRWLDTVKNFVDA